MGGPSVGADAMVWSGLVCQPHRTQHMLVEVVDNALVVMPWSALPVTQLHVGVTEMVGTALVVMPWSGLVRSGQVLSGLPATQHMLVLLRWWTQRW